MATNWNDYQEEAAALFRSMGLTAETNVTMCGVRTNHDIDVVVKSQHAGFDVTWLIECKHWKTPVSKVHVLALRGIVADLGADRGILLCEAGFQCGAVEAANLTNVHVTSLENVRATAGGDISAMRLRELYDRIEVCRKKYQNLSSEQRAEFGLDVKGLSCSGEALIAVGLDLVSRALRKKYPFECSSSMYFFDLAAGTQFLSAEEVIGVIVPKVDELEKKLEIATIEMENRITEVRAERKRSQESASTV